MNPMRFIVWWLQFMHPATGGGGGGGGGEAQAREDEARKAEARRRVNLIFGQPGEDPSREPFTSMESFSEDDSEGGTRERQRQVFDEAGYQKALQESRTAPLANKKAREKQIAGVMEDILGLRQQEIDDAAETERRNLGFALARRGLDTGSVDIDQSGMLDRAVDKENLGARAGAEASGNRLRARDEEDRLGILRDISAGLDQSSATAAAINRLSTNAKSVYDEARGDVAGRGLSNIGLVHQLSAISEAKRKAQRDYGFQGAPTPGGSGYGGSYYGR
jgi:hypothetical protein